MVDIALLIGVIVALTQLAKPVISNKYLPLTSVTIGVLTGFIYLDGDIKMRILIGVMIGLSAAGLFDQSKIITKKRDGK